jgi:hypothetical protein
LQELQLKRDIHLLGRKSANSAHPIRKPRAAELG